MSRSKILLLDIETSPITGLFWTLFQPTISHDDILQDWYIFCACWKWLGDDKVHSAKIADLGDDKDLCTKLKDVISSAQIVIAHNGDRFDLKKINARLIQHRLAPIPQVSTVDTLKEVRKVAAFTSNRLDFLAKILTGEGKVETKKGLWKQVLLGNRKALSDMVTYCKGDVVKLEEIYEILKPYFKSHPHVGVLLGKDRDESCSKCGSENLSGITKTRISASGLVRVQKQCNECHSYTTFSK